MRGAGYLPAPLLSPSSLAPPSWVGGQPQHFSVLKGESLEPKELPRGKLLSLPHCPHPLGTARHLRMPIPAALVIRVTERLVKGNEGSPPTPPSWPNGASGVGQLPDLQAARHPSATTHLSLAPGMAIPPAPPCSWDWPQTMGNRVYNVMQNKIPLFQVMEHLVMWNSCHKLELQANIHGI